MDAGYRNKNKMICVNFNEIKASSLRYKYGVSRFGLIFYCTCWQGVALKQLVMSVVVYK